MALTYTCDKCGHTETMSQIVGNEYAYFGGKPQLRGRIRTTRRFETLTTSYRFNGWTDVCDKCFAEIRRAEKEASKEERKTTLSKMKELLGVAE